MKLKQSDERRLRALLRAGREGADVVTLGRIAGFDPARDYRFGNWRGADFGTHDLSGFDFTGADLRDADLSQSSGLEHAIFIGAQLRGATGVSYNTVAKAALNRRLDEADTAAAIISLDRKAIFINKKFSTIFDGVSGLAISSSKSLLFKHDSDRIAVGRLLRQALADTHQNASPLEFNNGVVLRAPGGKKTLKAFAIATKPSVSKLYAQSRTAVLFILDTDRHQAFDNWPPTIADLIEGSGATISIYKKISLKDFGITPSELRVAEAVKKGWPMVEYCHQAGITLPTAKSYLSSLIRKTKCRTVGELTEFLESLAKED